LSLAAAVAVLMAVTQVVVALVEFLIIQQNLLQLEVIR